MISGLIVVTCCNPIDIVKTRMMNKSKYNYKSAFDCLYKTFKYEGLKGLYKGWLPNYSRSGPHATIVNFYLFNKYFKNFKKILIILKKKKF